MLIKIKFLLGREKYIVNVEEKTMLVINTTNNTREPFLLDTIEYGNDWIVLEASTSREEDFVWDLEDIKIDFKYKKEK